jgi:CelD/BcsL family acetyltransferase involved in cellulose biosynthesis
MSSRLMEPCMFEIGLENSFDFLSDEYRTLFEGSRATAFQHPLWLDRLYRGLVPRRKAEPLIIAVRWSSDQRLAMILPLVRRRYGLVRVIEFADLRVSDYAAPVCDEETFALIVRDEAACARIRRALRPCDFLRVQKVRDDALPLHRLLGSVPASLMPTNAHAVPLYGPFDKWRVDNLEPSSRKELDMRARRLSRRGTPQFSLSSGAESITTTFRHMRDYHLPRFQDGHRKERDAMQKSLFFDHYLDLAIAGAAAGLCRTYTMWLDGRPIAGLFGLTDRGRFLTILQGFDSAGYKNCSIGSLTFEAALRDCIERGDTVFDFTIGDEPYKRFFGAKPTAMWVIAGPASPLGTLAGFVTRQMPWATQMAKRVINRKAFAEKPS